MEKHVNKLIWVTFRKEGSQHSGWLWMIPKNWQQVMNMMFLPRLCPIDTYSILK